MSMGAAMAHNDAEINPMPIIFVQNTPMQLQSAGTSKPRINECYIPIVLLIYVVKILVCIAYVQYRNQLTYCVEKYMHQGRNDGCANFTYLSFPFVQEVIK